MCGEGEGRREERLLYILIGAFSSPDSDGNAYNVRYLSKYTIFADCKCGGFVPEDILL